MIISQAIDNIIKICTLNKKKYLIETNYCYLGIYYINVYFKVTIQLLQTIF